MIRILNAILTWLADRIIGPINPSDDGLWF
jgi:hypothetical protein